MDVTKFRAADSETDLFGPGNGAPPIVCGSVATVVDSRPVGRLVSSTEFCAWLRASFEAGNVVVFANASYDLACAAETTRLAGEPDLLPVIFKALRDGLVYDVLTAEALNAIYHGHLFLRPSGQELRRPSKDGKPGEVSKRYSLEIVTELVLGRADAKLRDVWRKSYALLKGISQDRWPVEARVYPIDDVTNPLEIAAVQVLGMPGPHLWAEVPSLTERYQDGTPKIRTRCRLCSEELTFSNGSTCAKAPRVPHQNLTNLRAQVEAAFALQLGQCWGLRTDTERVAALAAWAEEKHRVAVQRFQKFGWIRENGTEDQAAVKRAMVKAYGATAPCPRCQGTGTVTPDKTVPCRGPKIKNRYKGCVLVGCVCSGTGLVTKPGNEITCKNVFDGDDLITEGCDGSGYDLSTVPMLKRTDKGGVSTNRDTGLESGDDELAEYSANEFEKTRSTFVPYLLKGTHAPLTYNVNLMVETGRISLEGSPLHQLPRAGKERECLRARGAWCGLSIEYVFGSTDYAAGELVTLSTVNNWLFGYSQMREAIIAHKNPGILHSDLAAEVLGISLEEFLVRLKAKDKQAVYFRQASKPISFGVPGKMGVPKLVYTSREKKNGFTVCEDGPMRDEKGNPGYWGIRFCVLIGGAKRCGVEKIIEWRGFASQSYPCPPICAACAEVVHKLFMPAYFRRYPEMRDMFSWAKREIQKGNPAPTILWDQEDGVPKIIRRRGGLGERDLPAFCNTLFQSPLSDIGKDAVVGITRECYLGVKDDGSPSPLAGCRMPIFYHDEPVTELIYKTAHISGPRVAEIMIASGQKYMPGTWVAETALAFYLAKGMEPVIRDGILVPWEPEEKKVA
jgi:hypothetical protein